MNNKRNALLFISLCLLLIVPYSAFGAVIGEFTHIKGSVDITRPGEKAKPAQVGDKVSVGDFVRTKSDSKAEITFIDGSITRLAQRTRIKITEFFIEGGARKGIVDLFRGKVQSVVKLIEQAGKKSSYEVHTPTAVCGVRGTIFFTYFQDGISGGATSQGSVYVYSKNRPGDVQTMAAGQAMVVTSADQPPVVRPATDPEIQQHMDDTGFEDDGGDDGDGGDSEGGNGGTGSDDGGGSGGGTGTSQGDDTGGTGSQGTSTTEDLYASTILTGEESFTDTTGTNSQNQQQTFENPQNTFEEPVTDYGSGSSDGSDDGSSSTFFSTGTYDYGEVTFNGYIDEGETIGTMTISGTLYSASPWSGSIASSGSGGESEGYFSGVTGSWRGLMSTLYCDYDDDLESYVLGYLFGDPSGDFDFDTYEFDGQGALKMTPMATTNISTDDFKSIFDDPYYQIPAALNYIPYYAILGAVNGSTDSPTVNIMGIESAPDGMILGVWSSETEDGQYSYDTDTDFSTIYFGAISDYPLPYGYYMIGGVKSGQDDGQGHVDLNGYATYIDAGYLAITDFRHLGTYGSGSYTYDNITSGTSTLYPLEFSGVVGGSLSSLYYSNEGSLSIAAHEAGIIGGRTSPWNSSATGTDPEEQPGFFWALGEYFDTEVYASPSNPAPYVWNTSIMFSDVDNASNLSTSSLIGLWKDDGTIVGESVGLYFANGEIGIIRGTIGDESYYYKDFSPGMWMIQGTMTLDENLHGTYPNVTLEENELYGSLYSGFDDGSYVSGTAAGSAIILFYGEGTPVPFGMYDLMVGGTEYPSSFYSSSGDSEDLSGRDIIFGGHSDNTENKTTYLLGSLNDPVWSEGTIEGGTLSGKYLSDTSMGTFEGSFYGLYTESGTSRFGSGSYGTWIGTSAGVFTGEQLTYSGNWGEEGYGGYSLYYNDGGSWSWAGDDSGMFGLTETATEDPTEYTYDFLAMGEYGTEHNADAYLWNTLIEGNQLIFDEDDSELGELYGVTGGIWDNAAGSLTGAVYALVERYDSTNDVATLGLVGGELTGSAYSDFAMWIVEGTLDGRYSSEEFDLDVFDIYLQDNYYMESQLSGSFGGTGNINGYSFDGSTSFFTVLNTDTFAGTSIPFGIYEFRIGSSWNNFSGKPAGDTDWSVAIGGNGAFSAYYNGEGWSSDDGYWLATVTGTWKDDGTITGHLGESTGVNDTFGIYLTETQMGTIQGPFYGLYTEGGTDRSGSNSGTWIGESMGIFEGDPLVFGAEIAGNALYYNGTSLVTGNAIDGFLGGTTGALFSDENVDATLLGAFDPSESASTELYVQDITGWSANGGGYTGYMASIRNNESADSSYTANLLSLYVDSSGNAGYLEGYFEGSSYPDISMWKAEGTLGHEFMGSTDVTPENFSESLVSNSFEGSGGYSTSYGDNMWMDSVTGEFLRIDDQNWGIGEIGFGGSYDGTPSGSSLTLWGGRYTDSEEQGYLFGFNILTFGEDSLLDGYTTVSTLTDSYFIEGVIEVYGFYESDTWQGAGVGLYEAEALTASGTWNTAGYGGLYYNSDGYMTSAGSMTGLIGIVDYEGISLIAMGEYAIDTPSSSYLWNVPIDVSWKEGSDNFSGYTGGIFYPYHTEIELFAESGVGYIASLFTTGTGDTVDVGLLTGEIEGLAFDDSETWLLSGSPTYDIIETAIDPQDLSHRSGTLAASSLYGNFTENGTIGGYGGNAVTDFFVISDSGASYSLPFGIYNLTLDSNNYYESSTLGDFSLSIGGTGEFGYESDGRDGYYQSGYWLATITGTWNDDGSITGNLGEVTDLNDTYGVYLTDTHMGTIQGPFYGIYDEIDTGYGTWIGESLGSYEGTFLDYGGTWGYGGFYDNSPVEGNGYALEVGYLDGDVGLAARDEGSGYDFLAMGDYYHEGYGGSYLWDTKFTCAEIDPSADPIQSEYGTVNAYATGIWNEDTLKGTVAALYVNDSGEAGTLFGTVSGHNSDLLYSWYAGGVLHEQTVIQDSFDLSISYDEDHIAGLATEFSDGSYMEAGFEDYERYGEMETSFFWNSSTGQDLPWGIYYFTLEDGAFYSASGSDYFEDKPLTVSFYEYDYSYWLGDLTIATMSDGEIEGTLSGHYLTFTHMGDFSGSFFGLYDLDEGGDSGTWIGKGVGTYAGDPLTFASYLEAGFSDEEGEMYGIIGGKDSLWTGSDTYVRIMGDYYYEGNGSWAAPWGFYSTHYDYSDETYYATTTDGGAYVGFMAGIAIQDTDDYDRLIHTLEGRMVGLYADPDGNIGYIRGTFDEASGRGYPHAEAFEMEGTFTVGEAKASGALDPEAFVDEYIFKGYGSIAAGSALGTSGYMYSIDQDRFTFFTASVVDEGINKIAYPWGIYLGVLAGDFSNPDGASSFTLRAGGNAEFGVYPTIEEGVVDGFGEDWGYFMLEATESGTGSDWVLQADLTGEFITMTKIGTISGDLFGTYSAGTSGSWDGTSLGTWEGADLNFSSHVGGGIYPVDGDTFGYIDITLGGVDSLWEDEAATVTAIGCIDEYPGGNGIWIDENGFFSYDVRNDAYTTLEESPGVYSGYLGGIKQGNYLESYALALYIDPDGYSGYLSGTLSGDYFDEIDMFELSGTFTLTQMGSVNIDPSTLFNNDNRDADNITEGEGSLSLSGNQTVGGGTISSTYEAYFDTMAITDYGDTDGYGAQDWGIFGIDFAGEFQGFNTEQTGWTSIMGGSGAFGAYYNNSEYQNDNGYWYADSTEGTWETEILTTDISGWFMTQTAMGTLEGSLAGVYSGEEAGSLEAVGLGIWEKTSLTFSSSINAEIAQAVSDGMTLEGEGTAIGLLGGTASLWTGEDIAVTAIGLLPSGTDCIWYEHTLMSSNAVTGDNSTYDGGAYYGALTGIKDGEFLSGNILALYLDNQVDGYGGNAGYLVGNVTGTAYEDIGLFTMDGTVNRIVMNETISGINPTTFPGQLSIDYDIDLSGMGSFTEGGTMNTSTDTGYGGSGSSYTAFIDGEDWGMWASTLVGDYSGISGDDWTLTLSETVPDVAGTMQWAQVTGTKWSDGEISAEVAGAWVNWDQAVTGVSGGTLKGTFDASAFTWEAVAQGAAIETSRFLDMVENSRDKLAQLNIPCIQIGTTNLSGGYGGLDVNMNNVNFFSYSAGTAPKIWATDSVTGTYEQSITNYSGTSVPLSGPGFENSVTFGVQKWENAQWGATVNGSGTVPDTSFDVTINGAAAGTYNGGNLSGTGAGIATVNQGLE